MEAQISFYADSMFVKLPATRVPKNPSPYNLNSNQSLKTMRIQYRTDDREISASQRVPRTDRAKYNQYFKPPRQEDKIVFMTVKLTTH
jgi:hypothetical protein